MTGCPECNGVGYLLNDAHAGAGGSQPGAELVLNVTACYYPECTVGARPIASFQVLGMFTDVVRHPADGTVMALTGFTGPVFR